VTGEFFEFFCPVKIISGHKALANLPYEMTLLGVSKALVITDPGVVNAGLLKPVQATMKGSDCKIAAIYDKTPPDSSSYVCNEVAQMFLKKKCDCFIALGGGSCIDTAKGANIVISEGTDDLMKFQGMDRLTAHQKPLIVIPTTAGTGSEATLVAVIKDVDRNTKMPFVSDELYPALAIIDPKMTMSMPPKITAATGMDALTHAVEAYYSLQKNPISDCFATSAIKLIFGNLLTAAKNGADEQARLAMANASLMAGIAFSNAMVGVVHALAHAAGGICKVPHGLANAILLPYGMEYNLKSSAAALGELAPAMGVKDLKGNAKKRAEAAIQAVFDLRQKLHDATGMPLTLSEAGVTQKDLEKIAHGAVNDGSCTYNPEELEYKDAFKILKKAY